jgi:hypothetical protein
LSVLVDLGQQRADLGRADGDDYRITGQGRTPTEDPEGARCQSTVDCQSGLENWPQYTSLIRPRHDVLNRAYAGRTRRSTKVNGLPRA